METAMDLLKSVLEMSEGKLAFVVPLAAFALAGYAIHAVVSISRDKR